MHIATFRTEGFNDGERVPALLQRVGVDVVRTWVENDAIAGERWKMDFFTISIPEGDTVETVRARMQHLIETDREFADLHRCEQTLMEGDQPGDPFRLQEETPTIEICSRCSQDPCKCGEGYDTWPPVTFNS